MRSKIVVADDSVVWCHFEMTLPSQELVGTEHQHHEGDDGNRINLLARL
jgi:hypothetical protein